jgi:predicted HTH domain antitoxin
VGTTAVPVADELLTILRGLGEDPERAVLEATVLELFRRGELSRGRAAELLGVDLLAFLRLASARGIPVVAL